MVTIARECPQCKTLLRQKQISKVPESNECNQGIAIDFVGRFQNAINAKKYLLVAVDHFSGWPEAKVLRKPITENVIEFRKNYIARFGVPQTIRTDPVTIFRSKRFKEDCWKRLISHIECPVGDHRGNGKIERLIRTVIEMLRANKNVVVNKDNSGLPEILFTLRMYPSAKGKSAYEKYTGKDT